MHAWLQYLLNVYFDHYFCTTFFKSAFWVGSQVKLEQIKPSDNLPSLFALDNSKKSKLVVASEKSDPQKKPVSGSVSSSSPVGVVTVMSDSDSEDTLQLKNSNNHPGKNSLVPRKRR